MHDVWKLLMKFDTLTTLKWLKKWDRHEVWNNDGLFGTKVDSNVKRAADMNMAQDQTTKQ